MREGRAGAFFSLGLGRWFPMTPWPNQSALDQFIDQNTKDRTAVDEPLGVSPGEGDESALPLKPSARLAVVNHAKTDPAMTMHPCRTHPAPRSWFITGPPGVTGPLCPFHFCDLRPKQAGARRPYRKRAGREELSADNLQGPDFTLRQCRALFTGSCACPRPVHLLFPLLALVVYVCKCWRPWSAARCRRKTTLQPVRTPTPTLTHAKTALLPGNTISNSTLTAYFLLLVLVRAGTGLRCALVPRQSSVTPRAFPPPVCFHSYALERGVCTCTSHFLVAPLATDENTSLLSDLTQVAAQLTDVRTSQCAHKLYTPTFLACGCAMCAVPVMLIGLQQCGDSCRDGHDGRTVCGAHGNRRSDAATGADQDRRSDDG